MKKIVLFSIIILFTQACGVAKNTDSIIFRHVNLNRPFGVIQLDLQKSDFEKLIEYKNGSYYLKEDTFGFANSIELIFDRKNALKKAVFSYPPSWDKNSAIKEYENMLGPPTVKNGRSIWNDGKTQFEIFTEDNQNYSKLSNL